MSCMVKALLPTPPAVETEVRDCEPQDRILTADYNELILGHNKEDGTGLQVGSVGDRSDGRRWRRRVEGPIGMNRWTTSDCDQRP